MLSVKPRLNWTLTFSRRYYLPSVVPKQLHAQAKMPYISFTCCHGIWPNTELHSFTFVSMALSFRNLESACVHCQRITMRVQYSVAEEQKNPRQTVHITSNATLKDRFNILTAEFTNELGYSIWTSPYSSYPPPLKWISCQPILFSWSCCGLLKQQPSWSHLSLLGKHLCSWSGQRSVAINAISSICVLRGSVPFCWS